MRGLEFISGHVIYNPAYTYKFQLKTTKHCKRLSKWQNKFHIKWQHKFDTKWETFFTFTNGYFAIII